MTLTCLRKRLAEAALAVLLAAALPAAAEPLTAYKQALAETASRDGDLAAVYRARDYAPIWTGREEIHAARRAALLSALENAHLHALPAAAYRADEVRARLADTRSARDLGEIEAMLSRLFLVYARDVQTGVVEDPSDIDRAIVRDIARRDRQELLNALAEAENPRAFFRGLPPQSADYARLMKARMQLLGTVARGGWGPAVPEGAKLEPGDTGPAVVALRDRLVAMGYLDRTPARDYTAALAKAVRRFQQDHGLEPDGIAGPSTLEEINVPPARRLRSVAVAMERERWLDPDRGARHILVNLTDFSARIVDDGKVTFETRAVVGARNASKPTPEFSDAMEYMVVNPSWNVPRSIMARDYLPRLQRNRNAASYMQLVDSRGRVVSRSSVNFNAYSAQSFPFRLRQPPSPRNALGLVKFMFPNPYAIYLHDTPDKHLFDREVRTYSSGCVRLQQPFEFAYELLSRQTDDPRGLFHARLDTGNETRIDLETPVPVHLVYRTAVTTAKGGLQFRRDIYGRDARIWDALAAAGVALGAAEG
ncbi:murein L,D-transpeptidase [Rhodosalinus sp. 5P4]|uniref:L,D-transpeptidase family protein n=1 Tax=Rhodosalinus sp. 5P4 TaxID=3239196 RepID=UPI0035257223